MISAGTLSSPQILERSGIGSEKHLAEIGVASVVDLPSVGEHFQDHNLCSQVFVARPPLQTSASFFWLSEEEKKREIEEFQRTGKGRIASNTIDVTMRLTPTLDDVKKWKVDDDFKREWERKWVGRTRSFIGAPVGQM